MAKVIQAKLQALAPTIGDHVSTSVVNVKAFESLANVFVEIYSSTDVSLPLGIIGKYLNLTGTPQLDEISKASERVIIAKDTDISDLLGQLKLESTGDVFTDWAIVQNVIKGLVSRGKVLADTNLNFLNLGNLPVVQASSGDSNSVLAVLTKLAANGGDATALINGVKKALDLNEEDDFTHIRAKLFGLYENNDQPTLTNLLEVLELESAQDRATDLENIKRVVEKLALGEQALQASNVVERIIIPDVSNDKASNGSWKFPGKLAILSNVYGNGFGFLLGCASTIVLNHVLPSGDGEKNDAKSEFYPGFHLLFNDSLKFPKFDFSNVNATNASGDGDQVSTEVVSDEAVHSPSTVGSNTVEDSIFNRVFRSFIVPEIGLREVIGIGLICSAPFVLPKLIPIVKALFARLPFLRIMSKSAVVKSVLSKFRYTKAWGPTQFSRWMKKMSLLSRKIFK